MNFSVRLLLICALAAPSWSQAPSHVRTFVRFEDAKTTVPVATAITPDMLRVTDDGKPARSIDSLTPASELPVHYAVLFDGSGSGRTSPNVHAIRMAVPNFLKSIFRADKDKVSLVNFNDEYYLDVDMSNNLDEFTTKLAKTEDYRGGTALLDSIEAVSNYLARRSGSEERRVLLLFSDGEDNASRHNLRQAIDGAVFNHVEIYSLSVAGSPGASRGTPILRQLADATGGRVFEKVQPRQAADFFDVLKRVLESEYALTYTPADPPMPRMAKKLEIKTASPGIVAVSPRTAVP